MTVDLMVQIVTLILVGYGGWHLRRELRTLKEAVATQKATIEAQAEHMKAQSTVLQDFERLNKMMKEFIDTVDAPAMLQRWQQYKALGEYCLCNHLKGEDLSDIAVDPEPGKQRHGKVHHGLGLGDDNGLPFEAPKPMALAAMIPLDCIRVGFAHDQFLRWDHRSIDRPMISTLERDIP